MFEALNLPDISEMSMLVLQDAQFEVRNLSLEEQQSALEEMQGSSLVLESIVDTRFKIVTQVAYVPDEDNYTERYYHRHRNLCFTGGAAEIKFREAFDEYGGLVVTFDKPKVENIHTIQAREIKKQGVIVPVLAIAECVKIGHVRS